MAIATMMVASRLSRAGPSIIVTIRRSAGRHCIRHRCGGMFFASGAAVFGDTMRQLLQRRWPTLVADSSSIGNNEQDSIVEVEEVVEGEGVAMNRSIKHKLQAEVSDDGKIVHINFGDGTPSSPYHASWLFSNDPQFVHSHQSSGQRELTPGKYRYFDRPKIASARIMYCYTNDDGIVHNVEDDSTEELQFPGPTMGDVVIPWLPMDNFARQRG